MDPHFPEYLAAVAAMHDVYGEPPCDGPSEFHDQPPAGERVVTVPAAAA